MISLGLQSWTCILTSRQSLTIYFRYTICIDNFSVNVPIIPIIWSILILFLTVISRIGVCSEIYSQIYHNFCFILYFGAWLKHLGLNFWEWENEQFWTFSIFFIWDQFSWLQQHNQCSISINNAEISPLSTIIMKYWYNCTCQRT